MRPTSLIAIAVSLTIGACGPPPPPRSTDLHLLTRAHAPLGPAQLAAVWTTARRFATAYARSAYDPSPSRPPSTTPKVAAQLRSAAARIPPSRLGLHPRAAALTLRPLDSRHASVSATIEDGRSRRFSVGFELTLHRSRWLVTSISAPG
jgi:hypothetical protein